VQRIPSKPDYMSDSEYHYILSKHHHKCALHSECQRAGALGQTDFCSPGLDFDHQQPRSLGGDDGFVNIRPLCSSPNRGRPCESLDKWSEPNFWDGKFKDALLREVQAMAGYQAVMEEDAREPGLISVYRNAILKTITLLVGATGIGKTLMMLSALFAINKSTNDYAERLGQSRYSRPRVKNVLWLSTDQTLRDLTKAELLTEAYDLGLIESRPIVLVADRFDDLLRGAMGADITVSCPHSLWKVEGAGKDTVRRSDDEIRQAIEHFDVLVFDECDWASDQTQHIAMLASHALKFSLTASPPIMAGVACRVKERFLSRFVLINQTAIADYKRATELDKCLKALPEEPCIQVSVHDSYESLSRGSRHVVENCQAEASHPVFQAAILHAVQWADALEQRMKADKPDEWFSPHIMVRLDNINDIKALMLTLPVALEALRGRLSGNGWEATAIYQGHNKHFPKVEHDLSSKDNRGRWRHPFMLAKNNGGRVDDSQPSKRILLMCNIGVRGINNWPILGIVDCTSRNSVIDHIQFDYGRQIRWPKHLSAWWDDPMAQDFLRMQVFVPQSVSSKEKVESLQEAHRFISSMEEIISDAGFLTWRDLAAGKTTDISTPSIDLSSQPLTTADRYNLIAGLGEVVQSTGPIPPSGIDRVVDYVVSRLWPPASDKREEKARSYATRLLEDEGFRKEEVMASSTMADAETHPVDCTTRLRPKEISAYSSEELARFVRYDPTYVAFREEIIEALKAGGVAFKATVAARLRDEQLLHYRETDRVFRLHGPNDDPKAGVLSELRSSLQGALMDCGEIRREQMGDVGKAVMRAASKVFGIENAGNGGPMDQNAYHIAIMGRCRQRIIDIARGILVRDGILPRFAAMGRYGSGE